MNPQKWKKGTDLVFSKQKNEYGEQKQKNVPQKISPFCRMYLIWRNVCECAYLFYVFRYVSSYYLVDRFIG